MKTLIVEDSTTLCAIYKAYLGGIGLELHAVHTLADAQSALMTLQPDLVLLDIHLPDGHGLDLLDNTAAMSPPPAVVVMTGHGDEYADEAIRRGADDFLNKPFDAARLRVTLTNAAAKLQLSQKLMDKSEKRRYLGPIRGSSSAMQVVYEAIDAIAGSNATAFISGESGTGKELAAMAIHTFSARAGSEFVAVNCAAIPADLVESELFGEAAGVRGNPNSRDGLVKHADGGTLFLDEICDMPYALQSALLRFLQSGVFKPVGSSIEAEANVRIIAATNRDPLFEMREGRLREDLFYRLHVVPLRIPPLRERGDDVIELADFFLNLYAEHERRPVTSFTDEAKRELRRYPWPGNVRQLQNIVRRLVLMSRDPVIGFDSLRTAITDSDRGDGIVVPTSSTTHDDGHAPGTRGVEPLWLTEKHAIQSAIDACDGNINRAAGLLEVAPSTIYRKIQSWKGSNES